MQKVGGREREMQKGGGGRKIKKKYLMEASNVST